jgi:hypothetical protein
MIDEDKRMIQGSTLRQIELLKSSIETKIMQENFRARERVSCAERGKQDYARDGFGVI